MNVCSVFLVKYPRKMDFQLNGRNMNDESNNFLIHGNNAKMPAAELESFGEYQSKFEDLSIHIILFFCLFHRQTNNI